MVENVDTDGSGSIEFMEFLLLMGRILNDSPNQEDLRNIFTGREIERVKSSWSSCCSWALGHLGRILNDSPNQEDLRNIFTGRDIERVKSSWSSCSPWAGYSMIHPTRRTIGTYSQVEISKG